MDNLKIEAEKEAQVILNYFKTGDYISTEAKAKKLIKKFPDYIAIYNMLGLCLQFVLKATESNLEWYKKNEIEKQHLSAIVDNKIVIHAIYRTFNRIGALGENSKNVLHQFRADKTIMDLIKSIQQEMCVTVIMAIHDLTLAGQYNKRLIMLAKNRTMIDD